MALPPLPTGIDFSIGLGDTLPPLNATLEDANSNPVDLTTAASVSFRMKRPEDTTWMWTHGALILTPATAGNVSYPWQAGDTSTEDVYQGQFVVLWPGGGQESFPNSTRLINILVFGPTGCVWPEWHDRWR